jgi:hypothetical protein
VDTAEGGAQVSEDLPSGQSLRDAFMQEVCDKEGCEEGVCGCIRCMG